MFRCDLASHKCVTGASCDGDHTLVAPDGTKTDCAPYKCEGDRCKETCASIRECSFPNECTESSHTCVAPLASTPPSSGCSCRAAGAQGAERTAGGLAAGLLLLFVARRRERGRFAGLR
jgi:MYXO-CTERM domain-containing protein